MVIYKVLLASEWQVLRREGRTAGAPVDLADGFVHFSTIEQLPETLSRHFAGENDLMLLAIEDERLGDALKWEPSRGGALFPHLYRDLHLPDVLWAQPLECREGVHELPPGLA
ncbi:MAG: DUF952 domain-containing protein [Pseudomonadota bacterium]